MWIRSQSKYINKKTVESITLYPLILSAALNEMKARILEERGKGKMGGEWEWDEAKAIEERRERVLWEIDGHEEFLLPLDQGSSLSTFPAILLIIALTENTYISHFLKFVVWITWFTSKFVQWEKEKFINK